MNSVEYKENLECGVSAKKQAYKKPIWKNVKTWIVVVICFLAYAIVSPMYHSHEEHNTLSIGANNLMRLIESQDVHYQTKGSYMLVKPNDDLTKSVLGFEQCSSDCQTCEYASTTHGQNFTATVKCPLKDGSYNYLGYTRVPPGEHVGINGYYKKCSANGIYAIKRHLVNEIGPCFQQDRGIMSIGSGNEKRLVVETLPANANVYANGNKIGATSSSHNTITSSYGSFFWAEPYKGPIVITVSKAGYQTVEFPLDWDSYTHTSTVVLMPIVKGNGNNI